jgi:hypothetical protein
MTKQQQERRLIVKPFKGGFAVVDPAGALPNPHLGGEVITRTESKEQADDFVRRLRDGEVR